MAPKSKSTNKKGKFDDNGRFKQTGKRGRLFVRNLPYAAGEKELEECFGKFGKIVDISLPRHADNDKPKGFGFVDFQSRLSADKASEALNEKEFMGRKIYVERAMAKDRYIQKSLDNADLKGDGERPAGWPRAGPNENGDGVEIKEEPKDSNESEDDFIKQEKDDLEEGPSPVKAEAEGAVVAHAGDPSKQVKSKKKKARLIIRNLSFQTTEAALKEHLSKYGEVIDVNLLRRDDGRLVGCGFVEFAQKKSAARAIFGTSGKPFLGRVIIVDWALPTQEFKKANKSEQKAENGIDGGVKIKEEPLSSDEDPEDVKSLVSIKKEEAESSAEEDEDGANQSDSEDSEGDDESGDDDDDSNDESDVKPGLEDPSEEKKPPPRPRFESHDVEEGKTVFIKNLPFTVGNEELKRCVRRMFGPVYYALVCIDKSTEHSRGTAFVKFQNKEDAEKCLQAGTEFMINGTVLDPHPAIDRRKLVEKKEQESNAVRDTRNLYLTKEGVVLAGTPPAEGVSMPDMSKRLHLEKWKGEILKNLNMFVSRNRLIIHNLPLNYDDRKLRKLFAQHSRKGAVIKEARVMRDLRNVNDKGVGMSKGFGFVSFADFKDALQVLRKLNNNPEIFTEAARPIVAFSIENRMILNIKQKRLEKSRTNNPLCREFDPVRKAQTDAKKRKREGGGELEGRTAGDGQRPSDPKKGKDKDRGRAVENHAAGKQYHGVLARPGTQKMRTKYKLKVQAQTHLETIKKTRKEKRAINKQKEKPVRVRERNVQTVKKKKNFENDAQFNSMVNKYKSTLQKSSQKWYD